MAEKREKQKATTGTYVLIAILLVILIIAIIFAFSPVLEFNSVGTVSATVIESKMTDDGTTRNVKATYNADVDQSKITDEDIERIAEETMESFSYDELTGDNAMEKLKDATVENIQNEFGEDSIEDLYLSEFDTNASANSGSSTEQDSQDRRNEIMKGLFPKMRD